MDIVDLAFACLYMTQDIPREADNSASICLNNTGCYSAPGSVQTKKSVRKKTLYTIKRCKACRKPLAGYTSWYFSKDQIYCSEFCRESCD